MRFIHFLVCPLLVIFGGCQTSSQNQTSKVLAAQTMKDPVEGPVYASNEVDTPAKLSKSAKPEYPFTMRRANASGVALVTFIVDQTGRTRSVQAVQCTHPAFGAAAEECVKKWVYTPAIKNGQPVASRLEIPITFTINLR